MLAFLSNNSTCTQELSVWTMGSGISSCRVSSKCGLMAARSSTALFAAACTASGLTLPKPVSRASASTSCVGRPSAAATRAGGWPCFSCSTHSLFWGTLTTSVVREGKLPLVVTTTWPTDTRTLNGGSELMGRPWTSTILTERYAPQGLPKGAAFSGLGTSVICKSLPETNKLPAVGLLFSSSSCRRTSRQALPSSSIKSFSSTPGPATLPMRSSEEATSAS
mmetsp:Transcript_23955/g.68585  ORF Transcript_23955/g.68585 Transcript_23955/m.68585 type:complete len:222 (-) Transcript_23955:1368-2033(-)